MPGHYYEAEHFAAYDRIRREGLRQWNDLHSSDRSTSYERFDGRDFLERVLPAEAPPGCRVLEYGCGTGAASCLLARRGFHVEAVDLVPDAIAMARQFAAERGLRVSFAVQDVCQWPEADGRFDYVVDNFCLQSIVTDADRERLFTAVRDRLAPAGRYLINTAMYDPVRDYQDDRYDPSTGVVWTPAAVEADGDVVQFGQSSYVPNRRHMTAAGLRRELQQHGFRVLSQTGHLGGELVCTHSS